MQTDNPMAPDTCAADSGLLGYYFSDQSHRALIYIAESHTSELAASLPETVNSVYWSGYLRPARSGEYYFSTGDAAHTRVTVNGRPVLDTPSGDAAMLLNAGTLYRTEIWYVRHAGHTRVWLGWQQGAPVSSSPADIPYIPSACLVLPNAQASVPVSLTAGAAGGLYADSTSLTTNGGPLADSDNDGIPDELEINGYTVEYTPKNKNGVKRIVKWDDSLHKDRNAYDGGPAYMKYTSNPHDKYTTGDPYSDYDKVMGKCGADVSPLVSHPWIAAFPEMKLEMAAFSIYENDAMGNSTSKARAKYKSTKKTTGTLQEIKRNWSVSATIGVTGKVPAVSVTAGTGGEYGTTTYNLKEEDSGENNTDESGASLFYSADNRASTYASVRYSNIGTASIYAFKPVIHMRLTPGEVSGVKYQYDDITTIDSGSNAGQVADKVMHGGIYPGADQTIMFYQLNSHTSKNIGLNAAQYQQFLALQQLETAIGSYTGDFRLPTNEKKPVSDFSSEVKSRCVKVTVSVPAPPNPGANRFKGYDHQTVRYIYAADHTLTMKKILELMPELTTDGNKYTYFSEYTEKLHPATFYAMNYFFTQRKDKDLKFDIEAYCKRELKKEAGAISFDDLLNMKLTSGFEITLAPRGLVSLAHTKDGQSTSSLFYYDNAGLMVTGVHEITRPDIDGVNSSNKYMSFFDLNGILNEKAGWCEVSETTTTIDKNHNNKTYTIKNNKKLYFNGYYYKNTTNKVIELYRRWYQAGDKDFYFFRDDCSLQTGWFQESGGPGKVYGRVYTDTLSQKNIDDNGKVTYKKVEAEVMTQDKSGLIAAGLQLIKGYIYYFEKTKNKNYPVIMAEGFKETDGKLYYFKDSKFEKEQFGWNKIPETYPAGAMIKPVQGEWFRVEGKTYRVRSDGELYRSYFSENNTEYHFTKTTGELLFYTEYYNTSWRYGRDAAGQSIINKTVQDSDGNSYYFDEGGWCQLGWMRYPGEREKYVFSNKYNRPYGKLFTGWCDFSGDGYTWYYFGTGTDGTDLLKYEMADSIIKLDGKYYYIWANGRAGQNLEVDKYFSIKDKYYHNNFMTGSKGLIKSGSLEYNERIVNVKPE